jgi:hypothetical protein
MFDRAQFLALGGEPPEPVKTPAGEAHVFALTAGEKDRLDVAIAKEPGKRFRARVIQATARTAEGMPLFSEGDIPALDQMPLAVVEPLMEAALRVNRMHDKDVEALEKN